MNYDDETLMAYADGELDEPRRREIAAAIARDPALAHRVAQHRELRERLSQAFLPVTRQPVPERLVTTARDSGKTDAADAPAPGKVIPFPQRAARSQSTSVRWRDWGTMAAGLVLGMLISWRLLAPAPSLIATQNGSLVAQGALAEALDSQLASTQKGNEPVSIGLSFRAQDGSYCRSFALAQAATAGLACRQGEQWRIPATAATENLGGAMRQASSLPPTVLRAIETRMSGEALDATAEAEARRAGWLAAPVKPPAR